MAFGFWYTLQDDTGTLDPPLDSQAMKALHPYYLELVQILLRKSALPFSDDEAGDSDERELFRCYRQDVADTYTYCYNVLSKDLFELLGHRLSKADGQNWTFTESTIFAFKSLSDCVPLNEEYYIPAIMDLILSRVAYDKFPKQVKFLLEVKFKRIIVLWFHFENLLIYIQKRVNFSNFSSS